MMESPQRLLHFIRNDPFLTLHPNHITFLKKNKSTRHLVSKNLYFLKKAVSLTMKLLICRTESNDRHSRTGLPRNGLPTYPAAHTGTSSSTFTSSCSTGKSFLICGKYGKYDGKYDVKCNQYDDKYRRPSNTYFFRNSTTSLTYFSHTAQRGDC